MKFSRIPILLGFVLLFNTTFSQAFWSKEFPDVRMHDIVHAANGDLLCSFYTLENDGTRQGVIRTDPLGNLLWVKKITRSTITGGFQNADISEAADGSLYILSYGDSSSSKRSILRLTGNGDLIWARKYNSPVVDMAMTDNGVVTLGGNFYGLEVQRIDSLGNNLWSTRIVDNNSQYTPYGYNVLWASSGIYVVGYHTPNGGVDQRGFFMRLDEQGNTLLEYQYTNPTYIATYFDVRELSDGSLMVKTTVNDTLGNKPPNMGLARFDTSGNQIWHQMYYGTTYPQDMKVTCNDRILMVVNDTVQCNWKYVYMFEVDTGQGIHNLHWIPGVRDARVSVDDQCNMITLGSINLGLDHMILSKSPLTGGFGCDSPLPMQIFPVSLYDSRVPFAVGYYPTNANFPVPDSMAMAPIAPVSNAWCDSCLVEAGFEHQMNGTLLTLQDTSSGYGNAWLWTFGDGQSSTQQNPSHSYASSGSYTVCLKVWEGNCLDSICSQVNVPVKLDPAKSIGFEMYPNPAKNTTIVSWETHGNTSVEVLDLQGKTMKKWDLEDEKRLLMNASKWAAGLYFVKVSQAGRTETRKLVLQ